MSSRIIALGLAAACVIAIAFASLEEIQRERLEERIAKLEAAAGGRTAGERPLVLTQKLDALATQIDRSRDIERIILKEIAKLHGDIKSEEGLLWLSERLDGLERDLKALRETVGSAAAAATTEPIVREEPSPRVLAEDAGGTAEASNLNTDGRLSWAFVDGTMRIWDATTGQEIITDADDSDGGSE